MELANLKNEKKEFVVWLKNCEKLKNIVMVNSNMLFRINNIMKENIIIQEKNNDENDIYHVFKFNNVSRTSPIEICSYNITKFETVNNGYILYMKHDSNLYITK